MSIKLKTITDTISIPDERLGLQQEELDEANAAYDESRRKNNEAYERICSEWEKESENRQENPKEQAAGQEV